MRNGTDMNSVSRVANRYVLYGTRVELQCGTNGTAVGPNANRRWHHVRVLSGGAANQLGWIADRYLNTPNAANRPTPGEAECTTRPPDAAPLVWAGSPVESKWDGSEPPSPPAVHHLLSGTGGEGQWAVDLPAPANTPVYLYVAPQKGGTSITTKVDQIGAGCRAPGQGASFVKVGIYSGTVRVGGITYAHIDPTVRQGQVISRWGSPVGRVAGGLPRNAACWSGPHVHVEMFSVQNFACYNKGYQRYSIVHPTNFIGFTGGNVASGTRRACA